MTAAMRPDALISHRRFVRGLAVALVGDEAQADDLEQDVWVAALQSTKPAEGDVRAWLVGVLRNLFRLQSRTSSRRTVHESAAAASREENCEEAALESVLRLEQIQALTEHVQGLADPYRTALVLRFYDGLPPRRIAARLGIPLETVKSRIQRGLGLLRATLETQDRHEGRAGGAWRVALMPLTLSSPRDLGVGLGGSLSAPAIAAFLGGGRGVASAAAVLAVTGVSLTLVLGGLEEEALAGGGSTDPSVWSHVQDGVLRSAARPLRESRFAATARMSPPLVAAPSSVAASGAWATTDQQVVATFAPPPLDEPYARHSHVSTTLSVSSAGNTTAVVLGRRGHLMCLISHDRGEQWSEPILVDGWHRSIGETTVRSSSCAVHDGRVFVVWRDTRDGVGRLRFNASVPGQSLRFGRDRGLSTPLDHGKAGGAGHVFHWQFVAASAEDLYVLMSVEPGFGDEELFLRASHDGGDTWSLSRVTSEHAGDVDRIGIAVDPALPKIVHVAWQDDRGGRVHFDDVFYRRSEDGGATFIGPET